jgi:hypothetical protein
MFISVWPEPNRLCLSSFLFTPTHTSILFLFSLFFRVGFNLFPYIIWDLKSLSPCCEVIFQSNSGWLPLKLLSMKKFSVFIRRLINYVSSECQQISWLPMASRIETETQDKDFLISFCLKVWGDLLFAYIHPPLRADEVIKDYWQLVMVICVEGDGLKYFVNDTHKVMTTLILCYVHFAFMSVT